MESITSVDYKHAKIIFIEIIKIYVIIADTKNLID